MLTQEEEIFKLKDEVTRLKEELSQNTYKTLFEATPDIIFHIDKNYNILICHIPDLAIEQVEDLKGKNIIAVTPEVMRAKMVVALENVFTTGNIYRYESEGPIMGSHRHFYNSLAPIKNNDGRIDSIYFISRDVTQQKISEKAIQDHEQKLKALFGSSQHLHILMDLDARLVWFNKTALENSKIIFGRELKVGERMVDYLRENAKEKFKSDFNKISSGAIILYERHYVIENDKNIYFDMLLQPLYESEELTGISLTGVEITDRKTYEEKLEKVNRELVQHNQRLNQYSYIISHNLRGPIVTLLGLVNLFEGNKENIFREEVIGHIKTSALHLDNIIKDLNIVLSQTGKDLDKAFVSLDEELQIVKDLLIGQIDSENVSIIADFAKVNELYSVRSFIQSILLNLMSNALKYKRREIPLEINLCTQITEDNMVCLSFSDNGMGIDLDKNRDKIFGIYKRFHPQIEGKGLGLHLVKTQIDLLGGKIDVESAVDKGTTFKLYFSK